MDVACWRWGLRAGVEFVEQMLQGHGCVEASKGLARRFLDRYCAYHLQAQP
ncbi:hypothetical protein D3C84_1222730 [compost metagenome]